MSIDVAACIGELLYTQSSVIIPGIGGFVAKYQEAAIDQVQGQIAPPSTTINFNSNLVTNDGVLVNHIKNKYQISYEESKAMVEKFVEDTKAGLNNRKTIVFPKVGKLYKDYKEELQFLTDHHNFNAESFGLPSVQFYPVLKDKKKSAAPITPTLVPKTPVTHSNPTTAKTALAATWLDKFTNWFQGALPYVAAVIIAFVAIGLYFVLRDEPKPNPAIADKMETDIRINQKPNSDKGAKTSISGEDEDEIIDDFDSEVQTMDEEDEDDHKNTNSNNHNYADNDTYDYEKGSTDTEGSTIRPGQKSAIIIVGGFSSRANAQKRAQDIYKAGYEAYIDKKNKLNRVGILFPYETEDDINKVLRFAKRKFDKAAWILPDEQRQ